jgi:molybdate/tungstate transport system substrate-binding protein
MRKLLFLIPLFIMTLENCNTHRATEQKKLIIFHAGSLSVPIRQIAGEYEKRHSNTKILLESAGSLVCARKVTELKKPCDILASSDYYVINELLIPGYASWSIRFATNEIVIAFNAKSKNATEINSSNWFDILQKNDVIFSRADPDSDPCGYRTIMTFKLAEKYYDRAGMAQKLISKDKEYIRPKEVDLVALLEANAIDYMFQYKSVAIQHNLKYIELPKEINLSDPSKNELYKSVSVDVAGRTPGSKIKVTGDYINYSVTILDNAPDKNEAIDFLAFMISQEGLNIFRKNGQEPLVPLLTDQSGKLPEKILTYLK